MRRDGAASAALEQQLVAESSSQYQRIEFEPARRPDVPAATTDVAITVLNPPRSGPSDGTAAAPASSAQENEEAGEAAGRLSSLPLEQYLFPPERLEQLSSWPHMRGIGPGLANLGNTCFINATLQCLTYTAPLVNMCLERTHSRGCTARGFCIYCELEGHVRECHDLERPQKSLTPRVLVSHMRAVVKHFRPGRQEDAHEYLLGLIESVQSASLRVAAKARGETPSRRLAETTEVQQLFGGRLHSQVVCHTCRKASSSYESFLDLSLELKNAPTVTECLRRFTATEKLRGDNQFRCPHCQALADASKRLQVNAPPRVLMLQLKRFGFGRNGGSKLQKHVEFGERLQLAPFCTRDYLASGGSTTYELYAALVHEGLSLHGGHYYSYVKPASGIWHRCDDARIAQVSESTVHKEKAYLLFYRRIEVAAVANGGGGACGGGACGTGAATSASAAVPASTGMGQPEPELPSDSDAEVEDEDEDEVEDEVEEEEWIPRRSMRSSARAAASGADDDDGDDSDSGDAFVGRRRAFSTAVQRLRVPSGARDGVSNGRARPSLFRRKPFGFSLLPCSLMRFWWRRPRSRRRARGTTTKGAAAREPSSTAPPPASVDLSASHAEPAAPPLQLPSLPAQRLPPLRPPRRKRAASAADEPPTASTDDHAIDVSEAPLTNPEEEGYASSREWLMPVMGWPVKLPVRTAGAFSATAGTWDDSDALSPNGRWRGAHDQPNGDRAAGDGTGRAAAGVAQGAKRKRAYDYWDAELDRGHIKKTRSVRDANRQLKLAAASGYLRGGRAGGKGRGSGRGGTKGSGRAGGNGRGGTKGGRGVGSAVRSGGKRHRHSE